jgi:hypothetical protein
MNKPVRKIRLMVVMVLALCIPGAARPEAKAVMDLDRLIDHVVIEGAKFGKDLGRPIKDLRLMACMGGAWKAIPFQIDEKMKNGDYVMVRPEGKSDVDEVPGFDANDEVVFMAKDAGDECDPASAKAAAVDAVTLRDSQNNHHGYLYLMAFDKDAPPLSPTSYMRYEEKADYDLLDTPYYELRFPKTDVFMTAIIIHKAAGGNDQNILDKIKMRSELGLLSGKVKVERSDQDFVHKVLGHRSGPVRVLRQTETRLSLVLSLKSPAAVVNGSFYPACFQFPSVLSLPFRMDLVATDAYIRQGWDLNHNATGMKFYTNLNPNPVAIDGKMSPEEQTLAKDRNTLLWALGTGPQGTFIFEGVWDKKNSPIKAILFYEDDFSHLDPPENDPGVIAIAYKLEDLLKMGGEGYPFNIVNYIVPNFDGNLERARREFDAPLEATVK